MQTRIRDNFVGSIFHKVNIWREFRGDLRRNFKVTRTAWYSCPRKLRRKSAVCRGFVQASKWHWLTKIEPLSHDIWLPEIKFDFFQSCVNSPCSHTCSWKQTPDFHIVEIFQINQKLSLQPTDIDFIAESSPQNCLTVLSAKNENYIWTGRSNQRFIFEGV